MAPETPPGWAGPVAKALRGRLPPSLGVLPPRRSTSRPGGGTRTGNRWEARPVSVSAPRGTGLPSHRNPPTLAEGESDERDAPYRAAAARASRSVPGGVDPT